MNRFTASYISFFTGWLMVLFSQNYEATCIGLIMLIFSYNFLLNYVTELENKNETDI